jgi:repressor of nif and glnA expression
MNGVSVMSLIWCCGGIRCHLKKLNEKELIKKREKGIKRLIRTNLQGFCQT